ncbi:luciferase-like monooxygenase [Duganella sp. BK701]|uniref:LLM class flavin-dependent oxidoreductase n=1 Tax=unclassified Duganella TaxID=2636909 RepID=UPI000A3E845A|nr:luciferase-like monooxygenase [Duganella sp. BK701]
MSLLASVPFSALDVVPQRAGGTMADALNEALAYGRALERLGYHRLWLAEHHNLSGVASGWDARRAPTATPCGLCGGARPMGMFSRNW